MKSMDVDTLPPDAVSHSGLGSIPAPLVILMLAKARQQHFAQIILTLYRHDLGLPHYGS